MVNSCFNKAYSSITQHTVVDTLVIGAKVIFVDSANDAELIIDILESGDAVAYVNSSLKLLVDDFVALGPRICCLVVGVFGSVFLLTNIK